MEKNLDLTIGFKGQVKANAVAVPLMEGYLKLGGIVADTETAGLKFGLVCSADPDDLTQYEKGCKSGNVVRGIVVWDDAIAENAPGHPNSYLPGLPCAALNHGFLWLEGWTKTAAGATDPTVGSKVIYNTTSGVIEFMAANGTAPSGWADLAGAEVREISTDNGALLYLN